MTRTFYPPPSTKRMLTVDPEFPDAEETVETFGAVEVIRQGRRTQLNINGVPEAGDHPDGLRRYRYHDDLLRAAKGRVLLSGAGIYYDANRMASKVNQIHVIENNPDVIRATASMAPANSMTIVSDFDDWVMRRPVTVTYDVVGLDHQSLGFTRDDQERYRALLSDWMNPGAVLLFWMGE